MKALIAMSGGVDSSVAALLTKNMGYTCVGCTMRLFENEDAGISKDKTCCSLDDTLDARSVANRLDMPFYVLNFKEDFKKLVIDKFIKSYEEGKTPNPCIDCNKYMKFDKLYEKAKMLGCDKIVTGHYARIEEENGHFYLKKAVDDTKDQSYVLYQLSEEQLKHTLFPLGSLTKVEARAIAEKNGFINAKKKDSQDICFVPDGDYASVIKHHTGKEYKAGNFVDKQGNVLGKHKGIINYTIGQRRGLGISHSEPLYVCAISPKNNTVCLCENAGLMQTEVIAKEFNWINGLPETDKIRCKAKIRYKQKEQDATVFVTGKNSVKIVFDNAQRAVTPGQSAVLYDGDKVLGGGIII